MDGSVIATVPRWHVVQTRPAGEYLARECLRRGGGEVWLPECSIRRRYPSGAVYRAKAPLFPGYLFARFSAALPWQWMHEAHGVTGVLMHDEVPASLPDGVVEALQRRAAEGGGTIPLDPPPAPARYRKGQRMRFETAALGCVVGLYDGSVKDRIALLLDILGRTVRIEIPEALVTPA